MFERLSWLHIIMTAKTGTTRRRIFDAAPCTAVSLMSGDTGAPGDGALSDGEFMERPLPSRPNDWECVPFIGTANVGGVHGGVKRSDESRVPDRRRPIHRSQPRGKH